MNPPGLSATVATVRHTRTGDTALPGQRFGAFTELSPNGVVGGLAVGHGIARLSWTDALPSNVEPQPRCDVFAALRTGSFGAFNPPERVSTPEQDDRGPRGRGLRRRPADRAVAGAAQREDDARAAQQPLVHVRVSPRGCWPAAVAPRRGG
jgi:hypothetical protein